jgi:chromosome segregation ATPase
VHDSVLAVVDVKQKAVEEHLSAASKAFEAFADDYRLRLHALPPEVQRLLESHRDVLEKTRELPNLKARLAQLRAEIDAALRQLAHTSEVVAAKLDERLALRERKVKEFNDELAEAEVVLAVVPGTAKDDEFALTFSQFGQSKEVFDELRKIHAGARRFHRTLAVAYEELRTDLMSGDRVLFSRADFGRLIPVLENDDLEIRFAVGKPGERFSPIDQLSAGQRCTAVFPILLKLKDGPLVIDQPEDNLDNRHIARTRRAGPDRGQTRSPDRAYIAQRESGCS